MTKDELHILPTDVRLTCPRIKRRWTGGRGATEGRSSGGFGDGGRRSGGRFGRGAAQSSSRSGDEEGWQGGSGSGRVGARGTAAGRRGVARAADGGAARAALLRAARGKDERGSESEIGELNGSGERLSGDGLAGVTRGDAGTAAAAQATVRHSDHFTCN